MWFTYDRAVHLAPSLLFRLGSACFFDVLFRTESVEFHGSAWKCKTFGTKFANVQGRTKRKPRSSRWSIRCEKACTDPGRNPP